MPPDRLRFLGLAALTILAGLVPRLVPSRRCASIGIRRSMPSGRRWPGSSSSATFFSAWNLPSYAAGILAASLATRRMAWPLRRDRP